VNDTGLEEGMSEFNETFQMAEVRRVLKEPEPVLVTGAGTSFINGTYYADSSIANSDLFQGQVYTKDDAMLAFWVQEGWPSGWYFTDRSSSSLSLYFNPSQDSMTVPISQWAVYTAEDRNASAVLPTPIIGESSSTYTVVRLKSLTSPLENPIPSLPMREDSMGKGGKSEGVKGHALVYDEEKKEKRLHQGSSAVSTREWYDCYWRVYKRDERRKEGATKVLTNSGSRSLQGHGANQ
jgi:hypothetical protein